MKNINKILFGAFAAVLATGCVSDDDYGLPPFYEYLLSEGFADATDNTTLDTAGWTNYAEVGGTLWTEQVYQTTAYAEFSTFNSGDAVNVGWLISPAVNLDDAGAKVLTFMAAQHRLDSDANTLEILICEKCDGTNVTAATWTPLEATLPTQDDSWYEFIPSGQVDLSGFSGNVHIAFKVTGSGTNTTLDGAYQIDNVKLY